MAEPKTTPGASNVAQFIATIQDEHQRSDAKALLRLLEEVSGEPPTMWSASIVGFGRYHYRYASGRQGDTFVVGFAPRARNITLYLSGYLDQHQTLLDQLGKHQRGKSCLYIKQLSDVDQAVLRQLLAAAVEHHRGTNTPSL